MNKETACAVVQDLLPMYTDNLTAPETNTFVEQHLAGCESCRAALRNMQNVILPEERAESECLAALRRARIRRRRRIAIGIAVVVLALAVCLLPFPARVDRAVTAVRWLAGEETAGAIPVQVLIRGYYLDYLFRTDRFYGDVAIEGIEITQRLGAMLAVRMDSPGSLIYRNGEGRLENIGFIVASPGMKEFVIGLNDADGSWSGDGGIVLTAPAGNRAEAVVETRRILAEQNCKWLTESVWEAGKTE